MGLLAPGAVVAGCRIESVVGRGGMGVVYRAVELELGRVVALKVIAPELLEDPAIRERFLREARTAASIEHPNVIPIYAAGERDGVAYLLMRFIQGEDVRALVRRKGPLAPGRAAELVARAGTGLDAIHRAGYVHRDVKPANVLVDRDGYVYITDFGLAKQVLSRGGATATGNWVGTLDYVSPEQIRGGRVDARADVYALGGVLFYVLTGHVPFEREGDEAKLWAQLSEPPPAPSRAHPGVPKEFDGVIARALAKRPDARFPSAGDLGRAAQAAASGGEPSQPERMVARGAAAPAGAATVPGLSDEYSTVTGPRPQTVPRPARRRRGRLVGGALAAGVAAIAIVAVAVATLQDDSNGAPVVAPPPAPTPTVRVTQTIPDVGHRPNGVAYAGGNLWVASSGEPRLDRIDAETGRELDQHPVVGMGAASIASDMTSVWVAAKRARQVTQIDVRSGRVVRRLRPGGVPYRLAVGLGSVWVATAAQMPGGNEVIRYSERGRELDRRQMAHGVLALAAGSGALWIAERDLPNVLRIDLQSGRARVWSRLLAPAYHLHHGGGYLWATLSSAGSISRINPLRRSAPVTTAVGQRPIQSVVAGDHLFVTSNTEHNVRMFDPTRMRLDGEPVPVDNNPYAIAAGDGAVWVTGLAESTLTRIAYR
jgi:DNA-binding beta-propeller fold protein YncE